MLLLMVLRVADVVCLTAAAVGITDLVVEDEEEEQEEAGARGLFSLTDVITLQTAFRKSEHCRVCVHTEHMELFKIAPSSGNIVCRSADIKIVVFALNIESTELQAELPLELLLLFLSGCLL